MPSLTLKNGLTVIYDDESIPKVEGRSWSAVKVGNVWYVRSGRLYMHRLIMGAERGQLVDHINGDGLDNRISNLRLATHQLNRLNTSRARNKTGYIGVAAWSRGLKKFRAHIREKGVLRKLGVFKTAQDAGAAYDSAARALYGDAAVTNFPLPISADAGQRTQT